MNTLPLSRRVPDEFVRTKSDIAAVNAGCWFDDDAADRVVRFVETFIVPTRGFGADKPVTLLDWQRDDLRVLFGWKRADGRRRFRSGCEFIPRQNGKSFLATCIALYMLVGDREKGAYCVISAVTGEQTKVVFDEVANSVEQSKKLKAILKVVPHQREIRYAKTNSRLKGLSNEGWGKLGNPPHCAVMDEFCFWKNYKPYEALKTGMDSRRQPLLLAISTSGHDRTSVGYEMWSYAEAVLSGAVVDLSFFPRVYSAPVELAIDDPATWKLANPSLGVTVREEETANWAARAKRAKTEELQFRQYRLNQWVTSVNQFLDLDKFHACAVAGELWPDLTGLETWVGIDLSQTRDLTAVVSITPFQGRYWLEHHSFCCRKKVEEREAQNLVRYTLFEAEGTLTVHDGNIIDFDDMRAFMKALAERRNVKVFAFDPREASDSILILKAEGYTAEQYPPGGLYFDTPMKRLESWVNDGKLAHRGDSMILWQAQNLESRKDYREMMTPKKPDNNDAAKIDVMYATLVAIGKVITGEAQNQADAITGACPAFVVL